MRDPQQVLNALCEHSKDSDYRYERLYRILFNEEMFFIAYQRKYANQGNMTPGSDGRTIDRMSIDRIQKIVASLRDESYQPHPARRVYIPKKNGKKRPLGIPSFEDKLVQEVVHMILEAIYEGHFEDTSIWDGNVALAAHNRGVTNHFGQIHTLEVGDKITLTTRLGTRTYAVTSVSKVAETDRSALAPSTNNMITLYTCVRDQREQRWCVQGAEVR